jgi:hypothetical protein
MLLSSKLERKASNKGYKRRDGWKKQNESESFKAS